MKPILRMILTISALSVFILIAGCQSPGKIVSTQVSAACPQCAMQTVTTPIKGLTYTRHICPACKTIELDEVRISEAMSNYTSMEIETVHICDHCKSVVEPCLACQKM